MAKYRRRDGRHRRPRRRRVAMVPVGLLTLAFASVLYALAPLLWSGERPDPPQPAPEAAQQADRGGSPTGGQSPAPRSELLAATVALTYSEPVSVAIPAIDVDAPIRPVGVEEDDTVEVPPLDEPMLAGWYRYGPSPGEQGSAVILGHVTTPEPAVFFELGALMPGDTVEVARSDGTVAVFEVENVRSVRRDAFPVEDVYGPLDYPGLRLVTCGGPYDTDTQEYRDNVIVYASLVSSRSG